jgi:acetyltransferase-like isoleucine patch superfamily enzyme
MSGASRWFSRKVSSIAGVEHNGELVARVKGRIEGRLVLGAHHGIWTSAPTFLLVDEGGLLKIHGKTEFYGDNIIRVEKGAELHLGDNNLINTGTSINVIKKVEMGSNCLVSQDVAIRDNDGHKLEGTEWVAPVKIGDNVWLGFRSMVLKGVTIGDGAVVAAGAVVASDVPPRALVGGVPARVIREGVRWSP